jgi:excisionase family DNA binding protein
MRKQEHVPVESGNDDRLLVTVDEAARRLSIGRSNLYEHLLRGTLRSVRIGRSRRIAARDLQAFINGLLEDSADISGLVAARLPSRPVKKTFHEPPRRR